MQPTRSPFFSFINYLLLFSAGIIWGSQYFFTKLALQSFSTSAITVGRASIGILLLTVLLTIGKLSSKEKVLFSKPERSLASYFPDFVLIGLLEVTIPCVFVGWAQMWLASSVTAVLIGTIPLFTTLLEALFVKECRLSTKKFIAVLIGFIGIIVLVGSGFCFPSKSAAHSYFILIPALAVLSSALSFSISMLLIKVRLGCSLNPIRATQGILLGGLTTALPVALWLTKPWTITSFHYEDSALLGIIVLGIFCSGLAYTLFVILINRAGPSFASMTNYLVPPIGAFIGIAFSGESLTVTLVYSLLLILFSLWLANDPENIVKE